LLYATPHASNDQEFKNARASCQQGQLIGNFIKKPLLYAAPMLQMIKSLKMPGPHANKAN
jgi:hypothetical protein